MKKKKYHATNLDTSTPSIKDHVFSAFFLEKSGISYITRLTNFIEPSTRPLERVLRGFSTLNL